MRVAQGADPAAHCLSAWADLALGPLSRIFHDTADSAQDLLTDNFDDVDDAMIRSLPQR